jgi:hypothetical protein
MCSQGPDTGLPPMQVERVELNNTLEIQLGRTIIGLIPVITFKHSPFSLRRFHIWARKAEAVMNLCRTRTKLEKYSYFRLEKCIQNFGE